MRRAFDASPSLHPTIQAALGSLDVQLEAELMRYRRQRHMQRRRQHDAKPIEMIAVQAIGGRTQPQTPPVAETDPWQTEPTAPLAVRPASTAAPIATITALNQGQESIATAPVPDPVTILQPDQPADEAEPDDYLASSEELLQSLAEEEADLRRQRQAKGQNRLLTPLGIGSLLLMLLSSATLGYLVLNPGTVQGWKLDRFWNRSPQPVALMPETTSEPVAPVDAPSPDLSSEEFRDLNLDTLSTLPTSPSPTVLPTAASPIAPSPSVAAAPTTASAAPRPQATPERPAAIASPVPAPPRVTVSRRATPAAPTAQRTAPRSTARSNPPERPGSAPAARRAARPAARPQPAARPTQRAARPTPAAPARPAPAAPAPSQTAARPANAAQYYVVSPYSGDRSLEQAQRVIGDAYVRNSSNGAEVQYGAFSDRDRARELSQQLQQQGISAQVVEQGGN